MDKPGVFQSWKQATLALLLGFIIWIIVGLLIWLIVR